MKRPFKLVRGGRAAILPLTILALLSPSLLLAQRDMGPAGQYYKAQPPKKFKFVPGPKQKGGEVRWTVAPQGRVQFEKDEYALLQDDVKVFYQDITLAADKVTINLKTKDIVAEGHVIIDQGPSRISADHAVFNLDSKTGTFFVATATMETLAFTGEKLEKTDERTYVMTNGIFTSCDVDRPAWSFHVRSAEVTLDDYAHMKDLSFRVRDVPVFWAPRLIWPTKRDRSQGFLIPRIVLSKAFEVASQRLELGYFIPFGDSADTTVYADLDTKGYNGIGVNVRYLPSRDVKVGNLEANVVNDPGQEIDGKKAVRKTQWKYQYKHAQDNLPGGFRGVVDIQDYSDLDFFRRYDRNPILHTLSNIYSSAYLTKNRSNYSLNFLADRRDILLGRSDPTDASSPFLKQRFEQLPSLQFRTYPQRVGATPLYFSMESSASHLAESGVINTPNVDYLRADIFPTLSMQIRTPAWLSIKPQVSVRETYYSASLEEPVAGVPQKPVNDALNRFYGQGQVEVVGPSFSRVFNRSIGGFSKFKHVIEPRFRYVYTTNVQDQNRVIRFDTVDSPFLPIVQDSVEYSLTQRIIGKESGPDGNSREVLSFSLRQSASLSKPFTTATGNTLPGSTQTSDQKFTPLTASLHANPYQSITFDANASFGNVSHQLDQSSVSANMLGTGPNTDKYLSFTWFSTYRQPGQTTGDASQVRINAGSSLLRDRMRGDIQLNFDAKKGKFLEQRYLIGGTGSCYGIAFEYRRYLTYVPFEKADWSAGISVTLKNVGTIGTH